MVDVGEWIGFSVGHDWTTNCTTGRLSWLEYLVLISLSI